MGTSGYSLHGFLSYSVLLVFVLLCFVDPVRHCDHIVGEENADCCPFREFVTGVLSIWDELLETNDVVNVSLNL